MSTENEVKAESQPEAAARISGAVAEMAKIKAAHKATSAKPKAVAKTPTKAKAKVEPKKDAAKRTDRAMSDIPAADRRKALVKALRAAKATGALAAKPIDELATKLGYGEYDVYCLVYHKFKLHVDGIVKTVKLEGAKRLSAYLTKKGQTIELDAIG